MINGTVFYVGTEKEVLHHARPLMDLLPITIASPEKVLDQASAGDLAIFFTEHFDRFRTAIGELKKRRVATLYAIDGILEWRNAWENADDEPACPWTMRPVLSDRVACIGNSQARILASWGNQNKIEIVGIPRLDAYLSPSSNPTNDSNSPFRILVMTAKCPGFTEQQREQIKRSLSDLKSWFDLNPEISLSDPQNGNTPRDIKVIWRLTGDLENSINVVNELNDVTGNELKNVLANVDATITTPSTGQLESMLMERPTAVLDYTNSPALVDAAWKISSPEQIGCTIRRLLEPSPDRIHFQQTILHDALQREEEATQRMVLLVQAMLKSASDQLESNTGATSEPLLFHDQLLPPLKNSLPQFEMAEMFGSESDFENRDQTILQAELAHARREIKHLQRQIDGLRDELGEAHQIFDQINNHPIAGPVVRTRQKLLDWMSNFRRKEAELEAELESSKQAN